MRRFVTLVFLLLFTIPFGVSISGCSKKTTTVFCNGGDSGVPVGQVTTITLSPKIQGISLNFAQIGQVGTPVATDCKATVETVAHYTYATFDANGVPDLTIADVQPTTGKLCAGTWNRNTGGGIADFTTCNPTNKSGTAYVIASGNGASSNPLPIYVHPIVTSVVLGPLSTDCINDPATNCSPAAFINTQTSCTINAANGCCTVPVNTEAAASASANGCISQGVTGQLAARVYQNASTTLANNISCLAGHLTYTPQTASVVTIDQNGVATAQQPGSTVITAGISNAGSSAGFFSTCPPVSIALSVPSGTGSSPTSVVVDQNFTQPIDVTALDKNGVTLTGLALTFESTTPTTIPAAALGTVTPLFPGAASITATCQPPTCNPSPFNQIGLFGNGKPVTSNPISVTTPGTNATVLYIASTESLYIEPIDFSTNQVGAPVRLPYQPNSMVISNDGTSIYMGSSFELMTFSAVSNTLASQNTAVTGDVLAVSPDGTTLVITDPIRQLVYLYSTSGNTVTTQYGGIGTHAVFTPDSSTVYITLGSYNASTGVTSPTSNQLLVHSTFTGWYTTSSSQPTTDIAIGVPTVGAFFGGAPTTARSYCPVTTTTLVNGSVTNSSTTTNILYPDAGVSGPVADRIATTNDGLHLLGATVATTPTFTDSLLGTASPAAPGLPIGACPLADGTTAKFTTNTVFTGSFPGVTATAITGVDPTSDSKYAFVTYTGTGGVVPLYTTQPTGAGTLSMIPLATTSLGTPIAPVAGAVSADNQTFFVGTSGDNAVHLLLRQSSGSYLDAVTPQTSAAPAAPIAPNLACAAGVSCPAGVGTGVATPNLIVQKPRKAIS
jgi:trimeric autotransporter adhesin